MVKSVLTAMRENWLKTRLCHFKTETNIVSIVRVIKRITPGLTNNWLLPRPPQSPGQHTHSIQITRPEPALAQTHPSVGSDVSGPCCCSFRGQTWGHQCLVPRTMTCLSPSAYRSLEHLWGKQQIALLCLTSWGVSLGANPNCGCK